MKNLQSFEEAMRALTDTQVKIVALARSDNKDWKHDLVRLRRELQMAITVLGNAINDPALGIEDQSLMRRLRDAFSAMRSHVALHQAEWPVIQIERGDPEYERSTVAIRACNQALLTVAREVAPNLLRE